MPTSLREAIIRSQKQKIERLREGGEQTALREVVQEERSKNVVFDKYISHGQRG